jgi:hypothetical protein
MGESRAPAGHKRPVTGALVLPDGRTLAHLSFSSSIALRQSRYGIERLSITFQAWLFSTLLSYVIPAQPEFNKL